MKRLILLTLCTALLGLPLLALAEETSGGSAVPVLTQEERAAARSERQAKKANREAQLAAAADLRAAIEARRGELDTARAANQALRAANKTALKAARGGETALSPEQRQTLEDLQAKLQELRETRNADRQTLSALVQKARECLEGSDAAATQAAYQAVLDKLNARCDECAAANALLKEISSLLQSGGTAAE